MTIRNLFLLAALPAALALVGCGPTTNTSSPGKTDITTAKETGNPAKPTEVVKTGEMDESVKIEGAPAITPTVKQEGTEDVKLSLKRGKDLKADVDVSAKSSDPKVKVEVPTAKVPASGDGKFLVKVMPAADAAVDSETTITVEAKGPKGDAKVEFKVKVGKK